LEGEGPVFSIGGDSDPDDSKLTVPPATKNNGSGERPFQASNTG
jgi:hypothetical protein